MGRGNRRSTEGSYQRVRRAAGKPEVPGDEIPCDRADQRGNDYYQAGPERDNLPNRVRDLRLKEDNRDDGAHQVEDRRDQYGHPGRQSSSRYRCRDGVRGVVKPVGKVEAEGDQDRYEQQQLLRHS